MKKCHKCLLTKKQEDFNKNRKKKDGLASTCRACMQAYQKDYYYNNHTNEVAKRINRKKQIRSNVRKIKEKLSCSQCGEDHPATLDFHHTDPSEKDSSISQAISKGWSLPKIQEEMKKCEVLCSNCHRKVHWILERAAGIEPATNSLEG